MSNWSLALRVARREAWRNKKRSALVVTMLALPVAGASAADTLWRSSQITAEQKATWQMGRYDALVDDIGTPMYQLPDDSNAGPVRDASGNSRPLRTSPATVADLAALLPPGSRVAAPQSTDGTEVQVSESDGRAWGQVSEIDLTDPLLSPTVDHVAGSAPTTADEIALSSAMAGELHKGVGDTITVRVIGPGGRDATPGVTVGPAPVGQAAPVQTSPPSTSQDTSQGTSQDASNGSRTVRITGIYDSKAQPYSEVIFSRPGVFSQQHTGGGSTAFPIAVPGGVGWDLTQKLNAQGFTVKSKLLLADPPARSQVPYYTAYPNSIFGDNTQSRTLTVAAIALSIVLLEVVLLAGPAFAVSARRRRRDFGLLGAAGADGRRLCRIVLADGVVLGAAGGVIGAVVGVAAATVTLPWFGHFTQQAMGGFRLKPLELLAAALVGVGTGLTAAVAPAVTTARQDVLTALTRRRGQSRTPWKLPLLGLIGVVLGTALILVGAWHHGNAILVASGVGAAELGLVACTPVLVAWSGKLARALPLTGRLALRDSARNRGRTAPAVAAIMAAVAGATTVAMVINSDDAQQRHYYQSQLRMGQAAAALSNNSSGAAPALAAHLLQQISGVLPTSEAAVLQGVGYGDQATPATPQVIRTPQNTCPRNLSMAAQGKDKRCDTGFQSGMIPFQTGASNVVAGGPELVRVLLGHEDKAAEDTLKAGGAVVFDKFDMATTGAHPTVEIGVNAPCDPQQQQQQSCPDKITKTALPATLVDSPRWDVTAVVSPNALDKLGAKFAPVTLLFDTTRMPTKQEEKQADNLVGAAGIEQSFYVERGYQSQTWVGVLALAFVAGAVMLGAAAVATGLAITDAQADLETLAAVGARPRVRRLLAGSQAAVTAGLGAVLGAAFGLLPGIGLVEAKAQQIAQDPFNTLAVQKTQFAPPWLYLGVLVVALPLLAALGSAAFTRSRIEMRRRRG
ncbi:putative ABC transport system permease protein [Catenulispora sp. EB89]|uniref:FtsX-like permease family protein n=1 Tax=Catenulispora sp. EB89 TaxID=3156257 RepID=UPI00351848C1